MHIIVETVQRKSVSGCIGSAWSCYSALHGSKKPSEWQSDIIEGQKRIRESLARNQFTYQINGYVGLAGANSTAKTLADFLRAGDFASVEEGFDRALKQLERDPHAAITAACSIIEATCKTYIETFDLEMPTKQTV